MSDFEGLKEALVGYMRVGFFCVLVIMGFLHNAEAALASTFNVKSFGAKGDCHRVMDGLMSQGSSELISASAQFSNMDVGKSIYVLNAGGSTYKERPVMYGHLPLDTTIARVIDSHTVILSSPAQNSVFGVSVTWGTDDTTAVQNAIEAARSAGGGTVFFPAGMYRVTARLPWGFGLGLLVDGSNIRLTGTGDSSRIFNSSVHPFMTQGARYYHETGVSVAYVGSISRHPVANVEIDHLWFGDNGEHFNYLVKGPKGTITNPEGPGVLGILGQVGNVHLHDLTVVTNELCGINTDSDDSNGVSVDHVLVQSNGGNHGLYLAGRKEYLSLSNSTITSRTTPMRIGVVIKQGSHISIKNNKISNFLQQGIGLDANTPGQLISDILISGNFISNHPTRSDFYAESYSHVSQKVNTNGIQANNGTRVVIEHNTISGMNYSGIYIAADSWPIRNLSIHDNVVANTRTGIIAISSRARAPAAPTSSGLIDAVSITGNIIRNAIQAVNVSGISSSNIVADNCIQNPPSICKVSFNLHAADRAKTTFRNNLAGNCGSFSLPKELTLDPSNKLREGTIECPEAKPPYAARTRSVER